MVKTVVNHKDDEVVREEQFNGEKFQGDLQRISNEKRALANIDRSSDGNTGAADANKMNHEPEAIVSRPSLITTHDIDLRSDMFNKADDDDMLDII